MVQSGGGRSRPGANGWRCPVQLSAQTLGSMDEELLGEPWCIIREFDSQGVAQVMQGFLEAEGVRSAIDPAILETGIPAKFQLSVPRSKLRRARWILSESDLTDRELDFLATGKWKHVEKKA